MSADKIPDKVAVPRTDAAWNKLCGRDTRSVSFMEFKGLYDVSAALERELAEAQMVRDRALSSLRSFDPALADHIARSQR